MTMTRSLNIRSCPFQRNSYRIPILMRYIVRPWQLPSRQEFEEQYRREMASKGQPDEM